MTLPELRHKALNTQDLPFLKRYAFTDEREFRIIGESQTRKMDALDIPIANQTISRLNAQRDEIGLSRCS